MWLLPQPPKSRVDDGGDGDGSGVGGDSDGYGGDCGEGGDVGDGDCALVPPAGLPSTPVDGQAPAGIAFQALPWDNRGQHLTSLGSCLRY